MKKMIGSNINNFINDLYIELLNSDNINIEHCNIKYISNLCKKSLEYYYEHTNVNNLFFWYDFTDVHLYTFPIFCYGGNFQKWKIRLYITTKSSIWISISETSLEDISIDELKKLDTTRIITSINNKELPISIKLKECYTKNHIINCIILFFKIYGLLYIKSIELKKKFLEIGINRF